MACSDEPHDPALDATLIAHALAAHVRALSEEQPAQTRARVLQHIGASVCDLIEERALTIYERGYVRFVREIFNHFPDFTAMQECLTLQLALAGARPAHVEGLSAGRALDEWLREVIHNPSAGNGGDDEQKDVPDDEAAGLRN